jgi:hypothetical protein
MKTSLTQIAVVVLVACVALALPNRLLAQARHALGGAVHRDATHYSYGRAHDDRAYPSARYGWRAHYGPYRAYWGHPHYDYSWGLSIGIGFGWPYLPSYSYPFAYGAPYLYPLYFYPLYPVQHPVRPRAAHLYTDDRNTDTRPRSRPRTKDSYVPDPLAVPHPGTPPDPNSIITAGSRSNSATPSHASTQMVALYSRPREVPQRQYPTISTELQNAVRHLREMPPFAREREITRGRYSNFSLEQKDVLRRLAAQP